MDATEEINLGATVCSNIKETFYPDTPWVKCYIQVGGIFTRLKKVLRKVYPNKSTAEIIQVLIQYGSEDLRDALGE